MKEFTYKYEMPSVTVDNIVHTPGYTHFLLIKRKNDPHKGCYAFPGGFLDMKETIVESAKRELLEETSLDISIDDFHFFDVLDGPDRDTRGRVISHVFSVQVDPKIAEKAKAADDASELAWVPFENLVEFLSSDEPMAFDHKEVLIEFIQDAIIKNSFLKMGAKDEQ